MSRATDMTILLHAYRGLTRALTPFLPFWVNRRAHAGKEDAARKDERYGLTTMPRPEGHLVWLHGASVGECTMLLPLIKKFRDTRPDLNLLITSGTVTSAQIMAKRLPRGVTHQYVPLDSPKFVERFLEHWQPYLAIWAESEIWPNLILGAKSQGAKLALINARMSERSIKGWQNRSKSASAIFSNFDLIAAADNSTADGLAPFSKTEIKQIGNLKDAALPLPIDRADLRALSSAIGARPVWSAASTHEGEDEIIIKAHKSILNAQSDALLILAPRHPKRRNAMIDLLKSHNLSWVSRNENNSPSKNTQVYLFDTIGEMGLAYCLAQITCMCGSLLPHLSGHNPMEPARLENAVLTGPYISSFEAIYTDGDCFKTVKTESDISVAITHLFSNADALAEMQNAARDFCKSRADVLPKLWNALGPLLPQGTSS